MEANNTHSADEILIIGAANVPSIPDCVSIIGSTYEQLKNWTPPDADTQDESE